MKVLVIDPALTIYSYTIFEDDKVIFYKTIDLTKGKKKLTQESRLWAIFEELTNNKLCDTIDLMIVERQFVDIMGQIVGAIRAFAGKTDIKTIMMVPSSWRKKLTGKGNASEDLVLETVKKVYDVEGLSEHDIDCLAMYLAWKNGK